MTLMLHRCKGGVQRNTHAPHKQVHMRCVSTRPQSQPHYSCSPIMTDMCRTRPKKTCLAMQPEAVEIRDIQVICNTHTHTHCLVFALSHTSQHSTVQQRMPALHCKASSVKPHAHHKSNSAVQLHIHSPTKSTALTLSHTHSQACCACQQARTTAANTGTATTRTATTRTATMSIRW